MESAKQLTKLISEYRINAIAGGFLGDDQIGKEIEKQVENDPNAPPLAKLLCGMGKKGGAGIASMTRVWQYKDEIVAYQKRHGISSVFWRELDWMGEKIRFPMASPDLDFMPQDGAILSRWKDRTIDKFIHFIDHHKLDDLLYQSVWDDDKADIPVTLPKIYDQSKQYATAWLYGGTESPVQVSRETDRPGIYSLSKEILYYLTEYGLYVNPLPTPSNPEPVGVHFSVSIRRFPN